MSFDFTSSETSHIGEAKKRSKYGLAAFGIVAAGTAGLCVIAGSFIVPAFRKVCLPFVPATDNQVKNVMKALHSPCRYGMSLVDIGSGDGRIVFQAAAHGFHAVGYELNTWLVLYSKFMSWKHSTSYRAQFHKVDLWKANYSKFDNVVIFGVEEMMADLEKKLFNEMKEGSRIVACRFPLPGASASSTHGEGIDTVWSYTVKIDNEIKECAR